MMVEDNEIYNSIVMEFKLSSDILEKMESQVEDLTKAKMDLCNLLKIRVFSDEDLSVYEKELIRNIDINKSKIKGFEKRQIELKDKIIQHKQEIKVIKVNMNKLENKIIQERKQSKKYNEALRIFLKREKFKSIKKILFSSYRRVFLRYSNELSIKTKILQCNKIKEKIRQEKQYDNNSISKYKRKIIADKVSLARMRKCIINMEKGIDFFLIRIQSLGEYKEIEKKFILEANHYKKIKTSLKK
ncbi:hypothetical protein [Clostridium tagluense]|uniref:Uncharacterized protein n=1 Tax=Clostridium tagluense TaxID=360422 RepID=A0A401UJ85_9CLOT|nr:hypothetical protein [Clostridium tagluense]GCD09620.1 hypothetical protein Ctaglu_12430 [Clostridium tagluense]